MKSARRQIPADAFEITNISVPKLAGKYKLRAARKDNTVIRTAHRKVSAPGLHRYVLAFKAITVFHGGGSRGAGCCPQSDPRFYLEGAMTIKSKASFEPPR